MTSLSSRVLSWSSVNPGLIFVLILSSLILVQGQYGSQICKTTHLPSHSEVNCSGRGLQRVPWDLHSNIKIIDLSYNKLEELKEGHFTKYRSLVKIYLKHNIISKIHPETFTKISNLKVLDLSSNQFTRIPIDALNLPQLSSLSLRANKLYRIEERAFSSLRTLKLLFLDGNHIRSIHKDAFAGLTSLQTLELQNNNLQNLESDVKNHFGASLLNLRLYYNPWFCDCRINWLKKWLENDTNTFKWQYRQKVPECDGPSQIRGLPFSEVPLDHFACPPEMYSSPKKMELLPGDTTDLLCKFFSMPEVKPKWYLNNERIQLKERKHELTEEGVYEKRSVLRITDFQEDDMGRYTCLVENTRGSDSIVFTVSLVGIDLDSYFTSPVPAPLGASVDMKNVVISVAVVCGLILLTVSIILVVCLTSRYKRNKAMRKQEIAKEIKDHFLTNGDLSMKSLDHLDGGSESNSNNSDRKEKLSDPDDTNLFTNICRPSSPNGHTYMSFDSELTDNDELAQIYSAIRSPRHEGSHTESTTPLLDHYAPSSSVYDSRDPLDNSRLQSFSSVPRHGSNYYWSNSHIPRTPGTMRSNTIYNDPSYLYNTNSHPYKYDRNYRDHGNYGNYGQYGNYGNYGDYRDYRDYRYPSTTPPLARIHSAKKSASVDNLGISHRTPAPRKPPRSTNRFGDHVNDSIDDTRSDLGRTLNNTSFHGITPGTPV